MTKFSKELPLNTIQEEPTDQADILKSEEKHPSEMGDTDADKANKKHLGDQVDITTEPEDHQPSSPSKQLTDESSTPSTKDGKLQNSSQTNGSHKIKTIEQQNGKLDMNQEDKQPSVTSKDQKGNSSSFSLKTIWSRIKKSDEAKEKKEESANKSGGNSEIKEKTGKTNISTEDRPAPRGIRAFIRRVRKFFGNCCRRANRATGSSRAGSQAPQEEPKTEANNITEPTDEQQAGTSTPQMTLDNFIFHQILGEGAFGKVALASHSATNQQYAVKVVHKWPLIQVPSFALREQKVLRIVSDSRFFIHAFGTFQTENHLFYVLDYASGGDLKDFINARAPMDLETVRFLSAELLSGLLFLHSKGIVHRDMKPDNVLLDSAGHIKIGDFGTAVMNMYGKGKVRQYVGTPTYMAPEVHCNQPHNAMVDYFSLGIIVYKLATKKYPFDNRRNLNKLKKSICESAPSYPSFVDANLRDFTDRLLCKNQEQRRERVQNIRDHPLFTDINWEELEAGKIEPPFKMHLRPVRKSVKIIPLKHVMTPCKKQQRQLLPEDQVLFDEFTYQWKS